MNDLDQLNRQKERILSTIKVRGPSLPVQIAKVLGITPLFASVFLSELRTDGKLKVSEMRVGSSPLYFFVGQENQLEGFTKFLNEREREAFELLKQNIVLEDEKQTPVVRVALRAIKDFAIPMKVGVDGKDKIFWKYFTISQGDFERTVSQTVGETKDEVAQSENKVEKKTETEPILKKTETVEIKEQPKKDKNVDFVKNLKDYLNAKDIEIMEIYAEKKKEFEARIRIDNLFGKQEFYLVAKDKKSLTEKDVASAWQKSYAKKFGAVLMSSGELSKKAKEELRAWGNLVKFEKLKF